MLLTFALQLINQVGDNQDGGGVYFDIMPRCFRCWWPYYPGGTDAHSALNVRVICINTFGIKIS